MAARKSVVQIVALSLFLASRRLRRTSLEPCADPAGDQRRSIDLGRAAARFRELPARFREDGRKCRERAVRLLDVAASGGVTVISCLIRPKVQILYKLACEGRDAAIVAAALVAGDSGGRGGKPKAGAERVEGSVNGAQCGLHGAGVVAAWLGSERRVGEVRWSRSFGPFEGFDKVYSGCETTPSSSVWYLIIDDDAVS